MTTDEQIVSELQKLNQKIDNIKSITQSKSLLQSFWGGFLHSLGNLTGTIFIFLILIIIASRINWMDYMSKYFELFMSQIRWEKIIPTPQIKLDPGSIRF